jgi:hypothetical protein
MAKPTKGRDVPDVTVLLVVVVAVQAPIVEELATTSASVPVLTPAMHGYNEATQDRVWIQALATPNATYEAPFEPTRYALWPMVSQLCRLFGIGLSAALRKVSELITLLVLGLNELRQAEASIIQLKVVGPVFAGLELPVDEATAAGDEVAVGLRAVRVVVDREPGTEHQTRVQMVCRLLEIGELQELVE